MPLENTLGNISLPIEDTDKFRMVTAEGNSKSAPGSDIKAFIAAGDKLVNDYYYFQDAANPIANDYRIFSNGVYLDFERYSGIVWEQQFRMGGSASVEEFFEVIKQVNASIFVNEDGEIRNLIQSAIFSKGTTVGDVFGNVFFNTENEIQKVKKDGAFSWEVLQSDNTQNSTGTSFSATATTGLDGGYIANTGKFQAVGAGSGIKVQGKVIRTSDSKIVWQNVTDTEFAAGIGADFDEATGEVSIKPNINLLGSTEFKFVSNFSEEMTLKGATTDGTAIYFELFQVPVLFSEITDENNVKTHYEANPDTNAFTDDEKTKLANISDNGTGDHWVSGLAVTENDPKDQSVLYTAGTYLINGILKTIASGGTYDLTTHYSGLTSYQHRFVTVYVDVNESVKSIAGAVAEKEDVPDLPITPADAVPIALVEIKVDSSAIAKDIKNKQITDTRNAPAFNTDEFVKVTADDQGSGHLADKLSNNGNVSFTVENAGGIETLKADYTAGSSALPSLTVTADENIENLDVSSLGATGILYTNIAGNRELRSLSGGVNNQVIIVVNLAASTVKVKHLTGVGQQIHTEGGADKTFGDYGGCTLVYNSSVGVWTAAGIIL